MPVPTHLELMLPILDTLSLADSEMKTSQIRDDVFKSLALEESDIQELTPSGRSTKISVRFSWALTFMLNAGLIERVKHATYKLTDEGKKLIAQKPTNITIEILRQYKLFRTWGDRIRNKTDDTGDVSAVSPPLEQLEQAYVTIKKTLKQENAEQDL